MQAYLDNSATTRPTEGVIDAMAESMREGYFNPSSLYAPAIQSEKAMKRARDLIRQALGAREGNVVFTSGGTEANNLAILGTVSAMHGTQHILVSAQEHPSVLAAYEQLKASGHRVSVLPVDGQGQIDWPSLNALLADSPSLISCMQVNNETGAMPDLRRLSQAARAASPNVLIHVDGVQGFLRVPTDCTLFDLYTLSAHKLNGPKGIGALWARPNVRLLPRQIGGGQENDLRSGTENTPGIAGLYAAMVELMARENRTEALRALKIRLWENIKTRVPDAVVNGPAPGDGAPHILNLSFPGVRAEVLLHALEGKQIYCSTGSACSSRKSKVSTTLKAMGVPPARMESALRFSLSPQTIEAEIDYAAGTIGEIVPQLKRFVRR